MATYNKDLKANRVGKYSHNLELGVYQMQNIFAYQAVWGVSRRRDVIIMSGSASNSVNNGAITLNTGTTPGSALTIRTVRRGEYQPGKTAEAGVGAVLRTPPTGDGTVRIGVFDADDGYFYEFTSTGVNVVIRRNAVDTKIEQAVWNIDTMDGSRGPLNPSGRTFNPAKAYLWNIRFSYYGVGPIVFTLGEPGNIDQIDDEMVFTKIAQITPADFPSIQDPNKEVRVELNNGTTGTDIELDLGGRRFDILGNFESETRETGEYRLGATVTSAELVPLIAFSSVSGCTKLKHHQLFHKQL